MKIPDSRFAPMPPGTEVLRPFVSAGVFGSTEVHLVAALARLAEAPLGDAVAIGLAAAARGPRLGHVCIDLSDVEQLIAEQRDDQMTPEPLPWPARDAWSAALARSPLVATPASWSQVPLRPLVWDGQRLYLQRYWRYEEIVADALLARAATPSTPPTQSLLASLKAAFPATGSEGERRTETAHDQGGEDLQHRAARAALTGHLVVIAGGPGTGKTRTIARMLASAQYLATTSGQEVQVALTAPTGKAAARMSEAVTLAVADAQREGLLDASTAAALRATEATTMHRLLGWLPGNRFRYHRDNPLPHDLIVVDETSMVSLPLMAHLLEAVRPNARLALVGDPFQLASVEAGTVLSDIVGPLRSAEGAPAPSGPHPPLQIVVLRRGHRFAQDSTIAALAQRVQAGDADGLIELLRAPSEDVEWIKETDDAQRQNLESVAVQAAVEVVERARAGDPRAALDATLRFKVLCATRSGPEGLGAWTQRIDAGQRAHFHLPTAARWMEGRPLLVTANDSLNHLSNGDVGIVVTHHGHPMVAFASGEGVRYLSPARLSDIETWWAMTIHKSQGSEFDHVVASLPTASSPILTRELLYTALTRAKVRLTVVSSEASLRAAVARPVARASGLRARLWPGVEDSL